MYISSCIPSCIPHQKRWPIDIFLRSEKGGYSSGISVPPLIMEVTPTWTCSNVVGKAYWIIMHQSFVVLAPTGPGNSRAFNFSVFKALLNALHCGDKFMIKSLLKAPAPPPPAADNNEEQQMTWTIWINFLPLSYGGSILNSASVGPVVSEKIFEHTHAHTHTRTHTHKFLVHQNTTAGWELFQMKKIRGWGSFEGKALYFYGGGVARLFFFFFFFFFF